ncbi:MAG TPA: VWA domain-containing protein [Pirellulales bacterium]
MLSVRSWLTVLGAWRRPLTAYGVSVAVHAAALVGLGLMVLHTGQRASAVASLDAEFRARPEQTQPWLVAQRSPTSVEVVRSAGLVHGSDGGIGGGVGIGLPVGVGIALKDIGGGRSTSFGLAGATEAQLRDKGAQEHGPSANFFGTTAGGHNFVFVVDISGSMNEGGRFRRAKYALKKTLEELTSSQQFSIIFFSNDAVPLPGPGLISATAQNTRSAMRWVNTIHPDGDTFPMTALMMALRLEPDAIFLLSDGQFDPEVVYVVSQLRKDNPIPIHTIAMVSRVGEPVMKALSHITGGTFRFVH